MLYYFYFIYKECKKRSLVNTASKLLPYAKLDTRFEITTNLTSQFPYFSIYNVHVRLCDIHEVIITDRYKQNFVTKVYWFKRLGIKLLGIYFWTNR